MSNVNPLPFQYRVRARVLEELSQEERTRVLDQRDRDLEDFLGELHQGGGGEGEPGPPGPPGADGVDGVGVPAGGTTGQVLAKNSATDYDTEWVDQTGGGTGVDEVWIGPDAPTDAAIELWYDTDATSGATDLVAYEFVQGVSTAVWTITHPLTFTPNVTVVDSAGEQVEGEVVYTAADTITLSFSGAFSGKAYLS